MRSAVYRLLSSSIYSTLKLGATLKWRHGFLPGCQQGPDQRWLWEDLKEQWRRWLSYQRGWLYGWVYGRFPCAIGRCGAWILHTYTFPYTHTHTNTQRESIFHCTWICSINDIQNGANYWWCPSTQSVHIKPCLSNRLSPVLRAASAVKHFSLIQFCHGPEAGGLM